MASPPRPSPASRPPPGLSPTGGRRNRPRSPRLTSRRFAGPAEKLAKANGKIRSRVAADTGTGVPVGGTKAWVTLDDVGGFYVPVNYVLRGLGTNIEVWVQDDINFLPGDCRNDGVRNVITDAQVQGLVTAFDTNILPKESKLFSVAPARDGADSQLGEALGGDPAYYAGDGNKTVVLVSNVRDANYYTPTTPDGQTFIGGFFSTQVSDFFNRNVMSIDAYDWVHRTGPNPPNDGPKELCSPKQPAQPFDYESTFAHEYQHLLESYVSPNETDWLDEGLADYAQTAVGYVDTRIAFPKVGYDPHIACFQGYSAANLTPYCGPENSLTAWADQGAPSILADYGAAYSFLTYLKDHYGSGVISYLHRSPKSGLDSLQAYLNAHDKPMTARKVVHDWVAQNALDRLLDSGATGLSKAQKARFTAKQLSSTINWSTPNAYDTLGAPPNGTDYVLATAGGKPVTAKTLSTLTFNGAKSFPSKPLEWQVDGGALYSGTADDLDRAAIYSVKVPAGSPKLTFDSRYDIEQGWDFGVVQVSTDHGASFRSLAGTHTTYAHDPEARDSIVDQLPGVTGLASDRFTPQSYDLKAYAGKQVLVSFRYLTDGGTQGNGEPADAGWRVKNVKVGGTMLSTGTTLSGARSYSQVRPDPVENWNVQLIGWSLNGKKVSYSWAKLNSKFQISLSGDALRKRVKGADRIAVLVTLDDSLEVAPAYAGYQLRVNGTLQKGGTPKS